MSLPPVPGRSRVQMPGTAVSLVARSRASIRDPRYRGPWARLFFLVRPALDVRLPTALQVLHKYRSEGRDGRRAPHAATTHRDFKEKECLVLAVAHPLGVCLFTYATYLSSQSLADSILAATFMPHSLSTLVVLSPAVSSSDNSSLS